MIRDAMVWLDGGISDEVCLAAVADIARRLESNVVIGLFLNPLPLPGPVSGDATAELVHGARKAGDEIERLLAKRLQLIEQPVELRRFDVLAETSPISLPENEEIVLVGGGNSAGQAAVFLRDFAKKIWMLVRGPGLTDSMSQYLIDSIRVSDNIEVLTHTEIVALYGSREKQLERVRWRNNVTGEETEKPIRHVFLFIGANPATSWLRGSGVALDPKNFVLTGSAVPSDARRSNNGSGRPLSLETSIPGVFTAGDVRSGSVKQVGAAIGEGAVVGAELHTVLANGAAASARVGDEAKPREARNEQFGRSKG